VKEEKMATTNIDLAKLFGTVASTLAKNQTTLNTADGYNHNHGDNMVEIFEVITQAMKEKKTASPADQLAYASQLLRQKSNTGSAQLYAEGLSDASAQFKGQKKVTPDNAMTLIQTLLGAQGSIPAQGNPSAGAGGDLLGTLLTGLSNAQGQNTGQNSNSGADLLGSLLGGLSDPSQSGTSQTNQTPQIDIGQLLNAGMAFAQSKKAGRSNLDAILNAVVSSSRMGSETHRTQSGTLVADTLIQTLSKAIAKK
jgi:hypothetical protein